MKQILTRIDTTLLVLLSASIVLIEFNERNSTFFLAWLVMLVLFSFFVMVVIYSFVRSYKSKLIHPTILRFLPFLIGIVMIPALLIMSNYLKNDGFKSVVLKANYEGTHKGINLTLFKDNTFQLLNSGPFGGNYIRGNYRFVSDTLYMESEQFSGLNPTSIFILRVNDRNQKYLQPVASDSAVPLSLYVNKDRLTNK